MQISFLIILGACIYSFNSEINTNDYDYYEIMKNKNIDFEIDMTINENKKMYTEYNYLYEVLEYNQINKDILIKNGLYNENTIVSTIDRILILKQKIKEKIDIQKWNHIF